MVNCGLEAHLLRRGYKRLPRLLSTSAVHDIACCRAARLSCANARHESRNLCKMTAKSL